MTEKVNKRHSGLGKIFDRIFRGRSNSLPASSADSLKKPDPVHHKEAKKKKGKKDNDKKNKNVVDEFGIEETERLKHFQKPKPPSQRRRPRGVASQNIVSPSIVLSIKEEDENPSGELCHSPENEVSENKNIENVIVTVNDKVTQAPKLFTPSLPSVALREKLLAKKDRQPDIEEAPKDLIPEEDEDDDSIELIEEIESELRKKKESQSGTNSDGITSTKSSTSLLRSLSAKVDAEQIRSKSKNLRLVKSLEVGQTSVSENGKSVVRSSDPGRQ